MAGNTSDNFNGSKRYLSVPDPVTDPATDSIAPPGGDAAGAGSSGSPMAGAQPKGPGVTPPGGPAAQNVPPIGQEAQGRVLLALALGVLHKAISSFTPEKDEFKDITSAINKLMKHARPDPETQRTGKMPTLAPGGGGAGMPPGPMPPMNQPGGAQGAMLPRGPVPMGAT